jgi:hypothetical protein
MKITATKLRKLKACEEQVARFEREWPQGANVTVQHCNRAVEIGLDLDWLAEHMLTATAWAAYKQAKAPAFYEASRRRARPRPASEVKEAKV